MDQDDSQSEAQERLIVKTWRAWRTVHEMVFDRGYEIGDNEVNMSLTEFRNKFVGPENTVNYAVLRFSAKPSDELISRSMPPVTPQNPDPSPDCGPIYVEFAFSQLGAKEMNKFCKYCADNNFRVGIMVSAASVTSAAKKEMTKLGQWTSIECFLEEDLLINITHHDLVPRHIILSRDEKVALLKRYRLKETQLPRILVRDPIARYYGMKRGQIVKIIRKSETAGRYASYRLCV